MATEAEATREARAKVCINLSILHDQSPEGVTNSIIPYVGLRILMGDVRGACKSIRMLLLERKFDCAKIVESTFHDN